MRPTLTIYLDDSCSPHPDLLRHHFLLSPFVHVDTSEKLYHLYVYHAFLFIVFLLE